MIDFQRLTPAQKDWYNQILYASPERGCEYSFANLYLWGSQKVALYRDGVLFFSHFHGKSVYPYPIGRGDRKAAIQALLRDAEARGIPCRIVSITPEDKAELEQLFPGTFLICPNRDSFDYVYKIQDLADLKGRRFLSQRNHFNRFCSDHPDFRVVPLNHDTLPQIKQFTEEWFARRREADPQGDYVLESLAMARAFNHCGEIGMEGIALVDQGQILAMAMGSRLSEDTFDIHFEKARSDVSGGYMAINCLFARYLRTQHPELKFLNREDDLGIEGLRKAKLSYHPDHIIEKYWAYVQEDIHAD